MRDTPQQIRYLRIDNNFFSGTLDLQYLPRVLTTFNASHNDFIGIANLSNLPHGIPLVEIQGNRFTTLVGGEIFSNATSIPVSTVMSFNNLCEEVKTETESSIASEATYPCDVINIFSTSACLGGGTPNITCWNVSNNSRRWGVQCPLACPSLSTAADSSTASTLLGDSFTGSAADTTLQFSTLAVTATSLLIVYPDAVHSLQSLQLVMSMQCVDASLVAMRDLSVVYRTVEAIGIARVGSIPSEWLRLALWNTVAEFIIVVPHTLAALILSRGTTLSAGCAQCGYPSLSLRIQMLVVQSTVSSLTRYLSTPRVWTQYDAIALILLWCPGASLLSWVYFQVGAIIRGKRVVFILPERFIS